MRQNESSCIYQLLVKKPFLLLQIAAFHLMRQIYKWDLGCFNIPEVDESKK